MNDTSRQYPIGKAGNKSVTDITPADIALWVDEITILPFRMRAAASGLTEVQLDTPYREGGWTARQVIHHVADSHMNGYIRCKLALTEDVPTIKPYREALWAELHDVSEVPVEVSLQLLEGIHARWVSVLRSLDAQDFNREYFHPERQATMSISQVAQLYAWHGKHHVAHVNLVKEG